jgi:hypothetical protein
LNDISPASDSRAFFGTHFSHYPQTPIMPSPDNEQSPEKKDGSKNSLEEKIHRHLNDKNDHISDEDIRDVIVGSTSDSSTSDDERTLHDKAREMQEEIPRNKKGSSWDVLDDE